jgi:hypothetical protein
MIAFKTGCKAGFKFIAVDCLTFKVYYTVVFGWAR